MAVRIEGALALVEVRRAIALAPAGRGGETTFDLDLPEGAALVGWQIDGLGARVALGPQPPPKARAAYRAAVGPVPGGAAGVGAADEPADFRLRLRPTSPSVGEALLTYRFVAPLQCHGGRFGLRMPGSLDVSPVSADVRISFGRAPGTPAPADVEMNGVVLARSRSGVRRSLRAAAPARAAWELSLGRARPARGGSAALLPFHLLASRAVLSPGESGLAVGVCRPDHAPDMPLPASVLLVIDRSRSVGPAGLAAERDFARAFLEALPPSLRFNVVFFDRAASTLFPVPREATREALAALEAQATPALLRNGSDLGAALRAAGPMLRLAGAESPVTTWLVVATDGALTESAATISPEALAAGPAPAAAAVVILRPEGDDPAPAEARRLLSAIPARFGGIVREASARGLGDTVRDALRDLGRGGDIFAASLVGPDGASRAAGAPEASEDRQLATAVPPGLGLTRTLRVPASAFRAMTFKALWSGRRFTAPVSAAVIDKRWMLPILGSAGVAWFGASRSLVALVEAPSRAPGSGEVAPRGQMDRQVVRHALSFAYLPRARACYLNRPVRSLADHDLRGRMRLELHLERGEMVEAEVQKSTLGRPDIEACLRDAAFAVDVPRVLRNDAPVIAALNLVFQPRSPSTPVDASSALDRQIDLLLGPVTFTSDPARLLDEGDKDPH